MVNDIDRKITRREACQLARNTRKRIDKAMANEVDSGIDWDYKCTKCGDQVTDILSPVCYACRQKMILVDTEEYNRLLHRIEKLREALRRTAHRSRVLKKENEMKNVTIKKASDQ